MVKLTPELVEQIAKEELKKIAFKIQGSARENCPVDTGRLSGSIKVAFENQGRTARIGTNVEYAAPVEFGAKPHVIKPKDKKALFWKGAEHPVKKVNHPGMQGRFYLTRAFQEHKDRFIQGLKKRLQ